jgi:MFS family permease
LARELDLCLKPATRALIRPTPGGWRDVVRRHPLSAIYLPALAVNIPASVLNITYNKDAVIANWTDRSAAENAFERIVPVVNGILFPVAMVLIAVALRPIGRGLVEARMNRAKNEGELARLRRRALRLGAITSGICAGCWLLAGVVWPIALRAAAGPPGSLGTYAHFLISLVICGLIAAVYPYFLVTFLATRIFYPALLGSSGPTASDRRALRRVERDLSRYRAAAAGVPLLAVALIVSRGASSVAPVAVMGLAGLAGVILAYFVEGLVRADLASLAEAPVFDK